MDVSLKFTLDILVRVKSEDPLLQRNIIGISKGVTFTV